MIRPQTMKTSVIDKLKRHIRMQTSTLQQFMLVILDNFHRASRVSGWRAKEGVDRGIGNRAARSDAITEPA